MNYIGTSDFGYTIAASILASIGLATNNIPQAIGAMLISPLSNPVIKMIDTGEVVDNIIMLVILITTCIAIGMLYFQLYLSNSSEFIPTDMMTGMFALQDASYRNHILYGIVIGVCVYAAHNSIKDSDQIVLIGIAIGITVLPAFVNAGIMFGSGLNGFADANGVSPVTHGMSSSLIGFIYLATLIPSFVFSRYIHDYYLAPN